MEKRKKERNKQTRGETDRHTDRQTVQDKIKYQKEGKEREIEKEEVAGKAHRPPIKKNSGEVK